METLPKPESLLALDGVSLELFEALRDWFDVPDSVSIDLRSIDSAVSELADPQRIAAMAMRKLQALHLLATPGIETSTDVVVAIINDLDRALHEAPRLRLMYSADAEDWDVAFAELAEGIDGGPLEAGVSDPEIERFRNLHRRLHQAVAAVVELSEGQIRRFS